MTGPATATAGDTRRRRPTPSTLGLFFRGFLKHPVMVGAIVPSSDRTIRRMLAPVDWSATKLIVEYGPGVGTFTGPILERLAPDAQLIAIDPNPDFIAYLRDHHRDSRLSAVHGSAADVAQIVAAHGATNADYVLSGLPFSTLPHGVGHAIVRTTHEILKPGGAFMVYQYNPNVRNVLTPHFADIDHAVEWWNLPPAQLWWAWKS